MWVEAILRRIGGPLLDQAKAIVKLSQTPWRTAYGRSHLRDQKAVAKAAQAIKGLSDFKSVSVRQRRLELRLNDDAINTSALANVFMTLADNKVTLVSIRSVGQQTEQAFLDLVEKEESRGFARAYQSESEAA